MKRMTIRGVWEMREGVVRLRWLVTAVLAAAAAVAAAPVPAQSAFSGQNGKVAFSRYIFPSMVEIFTVNADGSARRN